MLSITFANFEFSGMQYQTYQWCEPQGKPWTLFRSKLQGIEAKLLVLRSGR